MFQNDEENRYFDLSFRINIDYANSFDDIHNSIEINIDVKRRAFVVRLIEE